MSIDERRLGLVLAATRSLQREEFILIRGGWGVEWHGRWQTIAPRYPACCPLGALLIMHQPNSVGPVAAAAHALECSLDWIDGFTNGFDDALSRNGSSDDYHSGWDTGHDLSRILAMDVRPPEAP